MIYLISIFYIIFILPVSSYFHTTHEFLGNYLEHYLQTYSPTIYSKSKQTIRNESFLEISTWADRIKSNRNYMWSKPLHYIDILNCDKTKFELEQYCHNNCIYSAILNMTNSLKYYNELDKKWGYKYDDQYEAFKFLIHFLQDFNQPMHLFGLYRGGNDYHIDLEINGHIRKTNLHTLWDSIIPEYYLHNYHYNYQPKNYKQLDSIYDYDNLLKDILFKNLNTMCRLPISKYIVFENYFNKTIIEHLFDNYMNLSINTLNYIYKETQIDLENLKNLKSKIIRHY